MTIDPGPLLSAVAASSSTLVAIVGGLLVARFLTLYSEQQGAQHLLDDAELRRVLALRRAEEATSTLENHEISQFFSHKAIEAIGSGATDVEELCNISDYYSVLSNDELSAVIAKISSEFKLAREVLPDLRAAHSGEVDFRPRAAASARKVRFLPGEFPLRER